MCGNARTPRARLGLTESQLTQLCQRRRRRAAPFLSTFLLDTPAPRGCDPSWLHAAQHAQARRPQAVGGGGPAHPVRRRAGARARRRAPGASLAQLLAARRGSRSGLHVRLARRNRTSQIADAYAHTCKMRRSSPSADGWLVAWPGDIATLRRCTLHAARRTRRALGDSREPGAWSPELRERCSMLHAPCARQCQQCSSRGWAGRAPIARSTVPPFCAAPDAPWPSVCQSRTRAATPAQPPGSSTGTPSTALGPVMHTFLWLRAAGGTRQAADGGLGVGALPAVCSALAGELANAPMCGENGSTGHRSRQDKQDRGPGASHEQRARNCEMQGRPMERKGITGSKCRALFWRPASRAATLRTAHRLQRCSAAPSVRLAVLMPTVQIVQMWLCALRSELGACSAQSMQAKLKLHVDPGTPGCETRLDASDRSSGPGRPGRRRQKAPYPGPSGGSGKGARR